jgi:hypothetical protein
MKDESRHVGFGMLALRDAVRNLKGRERKALEEFAFAACDMTITKVEDGVPRDGFLSYAMVFDEMAIPMHEMRLEMNQNPSWKDAEREMEKQFNSMLFVDTLIPCLRQLNLLNDRTEPWYAELGVLSLAAA